MNAKRLLAFLASATLIIGCSTPRQATRWEYKTITVANYLVDVKLNEMSAEGWILAGFSRNEGGSNNTTLVMKKGGNE